MLYFTLLWLFSTSHYQGFTSWHRVHSMPLLSYILLESTSLYQGTTSFYHVFTSLYQGSTSHYALDSASFYHGYTSLYFSLLHSTTALLHSTSLYHGYTSLYLTFYQDVILPCFYLTLFHSTLAVLQFATFLGYSHSHFRVFQLPHLTLLSLMLVQTEDIIIQFRVLHRL